MDWKLIDVKQETNHKFLNFFTLVYDVTTKTDHHTYEYYMVSRRNKEELLVKTQLKGFLDGVIFPLYHIDSQTKEVSILLTKQFRPAVGAYMTAMIAGLKDPNDKDLFDTCKREAKEECGAIVTDLEIIVPPSPAAVCLSDELNAIVIGRIESFVDKNLEEYEDIHTSLYPLTQVQEMMKDPHYIFPVMTRLILLYLINRFSNT